MSPVAADWASAVRALAPDVVPLAAAADEDAADRLEEPPEEPQPVATIANARIAAARIERRITANDAAARTGTRPERFAVQARASGDTDVDARAALGDPRGRATAA